MVLLALVPMSVYAENRVARLFIDGQELTNLDAPPIVLDDTTMVPARSVFAHVGGIVGWHPGHQQVTVEYRGNVLIMTLYDTAARLNGEWLQMRTPPITVNDRTLIPLRFAAEVFGFEVDWDSEMFAAIMYSPTTTPETPPADDSDEDETQSPPSDDDDETDVPPLDDEDDETDTPPSDEDDEDETDIPPSDEETETPPSDEDNEDSPYNGDKFGDLPAGDAEHLARDISTSPILPMPYRETTITTLLTPREIGTAAYTLIASSAISEVRYFVMYDNRLVVDIYNARTSLDGSFFVSPHVPVSGVRISQFSTMPLVTRVVFDVVGPAEFSVTLSADRRDLTISFAPNFIVGVLAHSTAATDSIVIQGTVVPAISLSADYSRNILTINIDNARMAVPSAMVEYGAFVHLFITGQRADGTAYINIHMLEGQPMPAIQVVHGPNSVTVILHPQSLPGIHYDYLNREIRLSREDGFAMDLGAVRQYDEYLRFRYTFVLPPHAEQLGLGVLYVFDGFVNSVSVHRDINGNIQLIIDTARVLTFTIRETPYEYIIRAHLPRDMFPFIIVIDPGHGGEDPGTIHNNMRESDLVLTLSHMLMQKLDRHPIIGVYATRLVDERASGHTRSGLPNELQADIFISIHANAGPRGNVTANGIETWYTMGNYYITPRLTNRQFAEIMQRHKIALTGANNRGVRHSPNMIVTRDTHMPAALLEVGFLSNAAEAARLASPEYQRLLVRAMYYGILEALSIIEPNIVLAPRS